AVVNAVMDAIGVRHVDMPLTPSRVWTAMKYGSVEPPQ
ncbi:carbon-monoxide dehydrogenase, large subunit, partial [Carbonactinospora thermoautotrophica]|nr:carbon-monoxide dehydrogenase, large subunit [Carbonactinospora thermoautotrophica]MCX9193893.1 carbon-monoxide dehydrogenase, large subunit [Carbonactinospora thermoautotrophica]